MSMKRIVRVALVGAMVAAGLLAVQPSASAAPCVRISKIWYDSPGTDRGSNKSLNAEWVRLKNYCGTARSLKSWTIRDAKNHVYRFGTFRLGGGKSVTVHTGSGTNTAAHRYQGRDWYVWNNDKDTAYLKNASGGLLDKCSYNNRNVDYVSC
ncbi:MAG: lamin tail domain-containing protein [Actinomycetota bacterium]